NPPGPTFDEPMSMRETRLEVMPNASGKPGVQHDTTTPQPSVAGALTESEVMPVVIETHNTRPVASPQPSNLPKINLGCGGTRLDGWKNHDSDIDISKKLPFANDSASFIFAEHVVEHIDYYAALDFFCECRRVLAPGGVLRIAVPSIER